MVGFISVITGMVLAPAITVNVGVIAGVTFIVGWALAFRGPLRRLVTPFFDAATADRVKRLDTVNSEDRDAWELAGGARLGPARTRQAAAALGVSVAEVRARLRRANEALRSRY